MVAATHVGLYDLVYKDMLIYYRLIDGPVPCLAVVLIAGRPNFASKSTNPEWSYWNFEIFFTVLLRSGSRARLFWGAQQSICRHRKCSSLSHVVKSICFLGQAISCCYQARYQLDIQPIISGGIIRASSLGHFGGSFSFNSSFGRFHTLGKEHWYCIRRQVLDAL